MIQRLLSPTGRAGREEWWTISLLTGLARICAMFAVAGLAGLPGDIGSEAWQWRVWTPLAVLDLALLWPLIAVNLRRAHDRQANGWFEAGLLAVATLAGLAVHQTPWTLDGLGWFAHALRGLPYVAGILILIQGCMPGTDGDNRYGPPARPLPRPAS